MTKNIFFLFELSIGNKELFELVATD